MLQEEVIQTSRPYFQNHDRIFHTSELQLPAVTQTLVMFLSVEVINKTTGWEPFQSTTTADMLMLNVQS